MRDNPDIRVQFPKKNSQQSQFSEGFTLLEVVVALAVILAALIGPVALITRGLFDFPQIKNKLVALNLAQEGIEVVRAVRENNIICKSYIAGYSWTTNSNGTGQLADGSLRKVTSRATDSVICGAATILNPQTGVAGNCDTDRLTVDATVGYGYGGSAPSIFSRCVTVTLATAPENGIPSSDMIDIISTVTWREQGFTKKAELRERLYKWEYPSSN